MPIITVEDPSKTYAMGDVAVRALRGVGLSIEEEGLSESGPSEPPLKIRTFASAPPAESKPRHRLASSVAWVPATG